mmetsp:Transcript_11648/g.18921  ORF Transcript_11648/g.18921 Transcript_11648/m.18921 type:complete len:307 (-) Transcript_11648:150-1070(-)
MAPHEGLLPSRHGGHGRRRPRPLRGGGRNLGMGGEHRGGIDLRFGSARGLHAPHLLLFVPSPSLSRRHPGAGCDGDGGHLGRYRVHAFVVAPAADAAAARFVQPFEAVEPISFRGCVDRHGVEDASILRLAPSDVLSQQERHASLLVRRRQRPSHPQSHGCVIQPRVGGHRLAIVHSDVALQRVSHGSVRSGPSGGIAGGNTVRRYRSLLPFPIMGRIQRFPHRRQLRFHPLQRALVRPRTKHHDDPIVEFPILRFRRCDIVQTAQAFPESRHPTFQVSDAPTMVRRRRQQRVHGRVEGRRGGVEG